MEKEKREQIFKLVDEYQLSMAKSGLMKFSRVNNNSSVIKDFIYSNEEELDNILGLKKTHTGAKNE